MSKEQNKNVEEKIEGQMELNDTPTLADTIKMAVDAGLVAVHPEKVTEAVELGIVDKPEMEQYEVKEGSNDKELKDGECVCVCGDHTSKSKVLGVINDIMNKFNGKVVLAMSEVQEIIKTIIKAIEE